MLMGVIFIKVIENHFKEVEFGRFVESKSYFFANLKNILSNSVAFMFENKDEVTMCFFFKWVNFLLKILHDIFHLNIENLFTLIKLKDPADISNKN